MNAPANIAPDRPDNLVSLISRARDVLDQGDLESARLLADKAYADAKENVKLAKRFRVSNQLISKALQLQGDALLIECKVKTAVANWVDEGQKAGTIATKGKRKSNVPQGNISTFEDLGVTSKYLMDARRIRDAELEEPGIAERAIKVRVEAGIAPTKSDFRAIGTRSASKDERGDDFYQTPIEAVHALLAVEKFQPLVWEPSCGHGAISKPMENAGYVLMLSDLVDRGCANSDGEIQAVLNFVDSTPDDAFGLGGDGDFDIVTNPPFGIANQYISHALKTHKPKKVAMLLNLNFLAGFADPDRNYVMNECPPARVYIFTRRLPMMHREGYVGKKTNSQMNTAWFVWERVAPELEPEIGPYGNETLLKRIDWKDFQPSPEAAA